MKINIAREKPVFRDTGLTLTEAQCASLTDGNTTSSGISITSGNSLSVICDLGARYDLYEVRYYRTRATTDTIAVAGRQTLIDTWDTLTVSGTGNSAAFPAGVDKYRYIRLTHSVTAGTGTAFELEIYTDDREVHVGSQEQGEIGAYTIDTGTGDLTPLPVQIRNADPVAHDYYVLLDPTDTDSSDYALASGIAGPYRSLHETGINLPNTYAWTAGSFTNTSVLSNKVRTTSTSGTYFTPVMDLGSIRGRRLFWKSTLSGTNQLDVDSRVDSQATVEYRMSNTAPTGAWTSGQLSTDSRWSVVSGTLPWSIAVNNEIMDPAYKRYFQARVEFHATTGQTPLLEMIGIEDAFVVHVEPGQSAPVYARSITSQDKSGSNAALMVWYFEDRDVE
jgi:hypothetical protein